MHDMDRTRVVLELGLDARAAREFDDDAPAKEKDDNDFERPGRLPGEARELELAMRLLDTAEGALAVARLAAEATRRGAWARHGVASATQVAEDSAGGQRVRDLDVGGVAAGDLGQSGRWIRRGGHIILLEA